MELIAYLIAMTIPAIVLFIGIHWVEQRRVTRQAIDLIEQATLEARARYGDNAS